MPTSVLAGAKSKQVIRINIYQTKNNFITPMFQNICHLIEFCCSPLWHCVIIVTWAALYHFSRHGDGRGRICFWWPVSIMMIVTMSAWKRLQPTSWSFDNRQAMALWSYHYLHSAVVERWSLTFELSMSCARLTANGWPLTWVSHPL